MILIGKYETAHVHFIGVVAYVALGLTESRDGVKKS